jgi:hypothetical protein
MKHIQTFESFVEGSVNEDATSGFNSKVKDLMKKFGTDISSVVSDWWEVVQSEQEEDAAEMTAIMKRLGSTPETTAYFSSANDEDAFEEALEMIKKSGLKYEERDATDGYQEVFIKAK